LKEVARTSYPLSKVWHFYWQYIAVIVYNNLNFFMNVYLNTFCPLGSSVTGRAASYLFNLPPYIEGSARREPDFQHARPCITGMVNPQLVKKLEEGDFVVYMADDFRHAGKRIVAVLKVIGKMQSHRSAASWYINEEFPVPNNLMAFGTQPVSPHETFGDGNFSGLNGSNGLLPESKYKKRAKECPDVAICRIWRNQVHLYHPPLLRDKDMIRIFGRSLPKNCTVPGNAGWEGLQQFILSRPSRRAKKPVIEPFAFLLTR
jgi:hypothetical protein